MKTFELLVLIFAFLVGYLCSDFIRNMCRRKLVEGSVFDDIGKAADRSVYHLGQFAAHPIDNTIEHPWDVATGIITVGTLGYGGAALQAARGGAELTEMELAQMGLFRNPFGKGYLPIRAPV